MHVFDNFTRLLTRLLKILNNVNPFFRAWWDSGHFSTKETHSYNEEELASSQGYMKHRLSSLWVIRRL